MANVILYSAISLNWKIARADGSVDWLEDVPNPDQLDYGYAEFYAGLGYTIMGRKTYQQVVDGGVEWPYPSTENYVLTRDRTLQSNGHVDIVYDDPIEFLNGLKTRATKDIWVVGGAQINELYLKAGLVDELHLFVMPVVLPEGLDFLPGGLTEDLKLELLHSEAYSTGVVQLRYGITR